MPARFRMQLGAPFVLTRAPNHSLLALSEGQWKALVERYENNVLFRGYYLSAAVECPVDPTTGRFLVPHALREYAELRPMDEVAIAGIGRAVQVVKRTHYDEALERGEFPTLGQLDLDLDVPRPGEATPYRQRVAHPMGLALVEARGRLDGRAVRRLGATVLRLLKQDPPVVILDARETGETEPALPQLMSLLRGQLEATGVPLLIVAQVAPETVQPAVVFPDIESVLWQMERIRPDEARPRMFAGGAPPEDVDNSDLSDDL